MGKHQARYRAFMLRLWCVEEKGESTWRASLEDPHTGERKGFADLESLLVFLKEATRAGTGPPVMRICEDDAQLR